ncbi:MAG: sugar transferase [Alphaproteobacteria bacterium]|nr:MAG: sugar transferase [Alphaproteobacteria bacterium]
MNKRGSIFVKRCVDILCSSLGLVILSPLFGIIAFAIRLTSWGPVIFHQKRCGLKKCEFTLYKFRSMVEGAQNKGLGYAVEKNDFRITKVGKFIRATSIDELPQLYNVLKGDMSLVGPRPTISSEVEKFSKEMQKRQDVRPGITGWAQVNGRNSLSWDDKLLLDVWYVENWNLWLDIKILFKTPLALFDKESIYGVDGVVKGKE